MHKRISLFKAPSGKAAATCRQGAAAVAGSGTAARCQRRGSGPHLPGSAPDLFWAARLTQPAPSPDRLCSLPNKARRELTGWLRGHPVFTLRASGSRSLAALLCSIPALAGPRQPGHIGTAAAAEGDTLWIHRTASNRRECRHSFHHSTLQDH